MQTGANTIDNNQFYKRLWQLAAPIALQSLMLASVAAGDALMLGRVAQEEMTAVSLATQIQFVQNMFLMAITAAGSILGAQYWGKGDRPAMRKLFNLMLRFAVLVSLLFFAVCELLPEVLMQLFTPDAVLIEIGSTYLRIAGWPYLLVGISQCCLAMMKVTDHVTPSAWISSGSGSTNGCAIWRRNICEHALRRAEVNVKWSGGIIIIGKCLDRCRRWNDCGANKVSHPSGF